jgi:predicted PhzF superfamily epimerase YddE/YHI9
MPTYSFIQCDVFTDQVFGGNPLAVFPDGRGIDDATMQKIAREMNLSETAGTLSAALVHYGVVAPVDGIARFIIEQGVDLGRPSRIEAEVEGARGVVKTVRIGGESVVVLTGEISW